MSGSPVIPGLGDPPIRSHTPRRVMAPSIRVPPAGQIGDVIRTQGVRRATQVTGPGLSRARSDDERSRLRVVVTATEKGAAMPATTEKSSGTTAVRPFTIPVTSQTTAKDLS